MYDMDNQDSDYRESALYRKVKGFTAAPRITFQTVTGLGEAELGGLIRVRLDGHTAGFLAQDDEDLLWTYTRPNNQADLAKTFELISDAKAFVRAQIIERETNDKS